MKYEPKFHEDVSNLEELIFFEDCILSCILLKGKL